MALETLAEFSPSEILPFVPRKKSNFKIGDQEFVVKTCSMRLQVFKKSLVCVGCGLVGSVLKLQRQPDRNERPHLNLYAKRENENGTVEWVLMTQDHIRPRSKGGKDRLDNLQTMCAECNVKKGSDFHDEQDCGVQV